MCKKLVFLIALIAACASPCVQGAKIVWVTEAIPASGALNDQTFVDFLTAQGYVVDVQAGSWMTLDAAKLAALEAADLVIVSRNTNSKNYCNDATETAQWSAVTTPMICVNAYFTRPSKWLWINTETATEYSAESALQVVKADHPLFAGVPVTGGQVDVVDGTVSTGQMTFVSAADAGNGTVIAKRAGDGYLWIVEWAAGTPFYSSSTQTPAGKRLLFVAGGGGGQTAGALNLTPEGCKMFLNAVRYMMGISVDAGIAVSPSPANKEPDALRDSKLAWTAGEGAATHDVYFGALADVNEASRTNPKDVLVAKDQAGTTFDPGRLQFGQTCYWRVDEVEQNGTVHKGEIWSFTVEAYSYPIEGSRITPAASSSSANMGPEKTIDGSGLDAGDHHSTVPEQMWTSAMDGTRPDWIRYDFDKPYMLDKLLVWNSNQGMESVVGFGAKDVAIEYSPDGSTWTSLGQFVFARAPGDDTCTAGTTVDFHNAVAKAVKLTITSNWAGLLPQSGLSEVRFLAVPTFARQPVPAPNAVGTNPQATLSWRSGREAASHQLYLSTDQQAVIDGTAPVVTTSQASHAATVDLATTYYWKVVEVNEAKDPSTWPSDVWSFTTADYVPVDDFERYTNDSPNRVFQTWTDGMGFSADTYYPNGGNGNGTGSALGYDPQQRDIMQKTVVHGGAQSVPFFYANTAAMPTSEITRTFSDPWDWTASGIETLTLYFYGDANNTGSDPLWVKLTDQNKNSTKVTFGSGPGEIPGSLLEPAWTEWNIPLTGFGHNLTKVVSITIGMGPGTGSGRLFLDDIRLYPARTAAVLPAAVLVGQWKFDNDAEDSSGNANDGTLVGGPTYDAAGKFGAALSLDGVDDGVDCGNGESLNITDAVSLAVWVKTSDAGNAQHNEFVSKGDHSYGLKHNIGNYLEFAVYSGTAWYSANGPVVTSAFNDAWHHVAGTFDGTQCKLYLDGKLIASRLRTGAIGTTTYKVGIGRNSEYTDRLLSGKLDDVRIYHGVLSSAEIAAMPK